MKIYSVKPDGKLKQFAAMDPSNGGGIFKGEWTICYKISDDGTNVDMTITDVNEKHRGAGEHLILGKYFEVRDDHKIIQSKITGQGEDVDKGFGQDPPSSNEGIMSEQEAARQQERQQMESGQTIEEGPEKVTF